MGGFRHLGDFPRKAAPIKENLSRIISWLARSSALTPRTRDFPFELRRAVAELLAFDRASWRVVFRAKGEHDLLAAKLGQRDFRASVCLQREIEGGGRLVRDRWSRRLAPQDRARSFRGFLDEVSHLGMGWLEVGLETVLAKRFGADGPDAREDRAFEALQERLFGSFGAGCGEYAVDLVCAGEESDLDLSV